MLDTDKKEHNPLESLRRFLQSNTPLLLVIGEGSSSKSQLLSQLVADVQVDQRVIRLQGERHLQPAQLTTLLSRHWGLNIDLSNASYRHQLDAVITDLTHKQQSCVLIVDDAHRLPISTLAALSHLTIKQDNGTVYLHVLLLGKPELLK